MKKEVIVLVVDKPAGRPGPYEQIAITMQQTFSGVHDIEAYAFRDDSETEAILNILGIPQGEDKLPDIPTEEDIPL